MSDICSERPGLKLTFEVLREDDTLIVWKLDRLGRSVKSLVDFIGELAGRGVQFKSLTDSIDTTNPSGRFYSHVMASLSQMVRVLIIERTQAGVIAACQSALNFNPPLAVDFSY